MYVAQNPMPTSFTLHFYPDGEKKKEKRSKIDVRCLDDWYSTHSFNIFSCRTSGCYFQARFSCVTDQLNHKRKKKAADWLAYSAIIVTARPFKADIFPQQKNAECAAQLTFQRWGSVAMSFWKWSADRDIFRHEWRTAVLRLGCEKTGLKDGR